ncbi:MAG: nucleotide exchange factor GrpE [Candidatus Abyssubacteria bacterium]
MKHKENPQENNIERNNDRKSEDLRDDETNTAEGGESSQEQQAETAPAEEPSLSPEEIRNLIKEKEELYDRLLRTQADFENYRKRVQREQASLVKYAAEQAISQMLPIIDNLERALDSALKHEDPNSQLREGLKLILTQSRGALEKLGVRPIESVGHPFDPNKHDALIRTHAPDKPEGTVIDEILKGYYLYDKVLRPAQVIVSTCESVHGEEPQEGT